MPDKKEEERKPNMSEVKDFKRNSLKRTETKASNTLPTQEVIDQEKQAIQQKSS